MPALTVRGAFPYPDAADNWKVLRTQVQALAERAAAVSALFVESSAADRPAAGTSGRFHRAMDTGALSLDFGTAWIGLPTSVVGKAADSNLLDGIDSTQFLLKIEGAAAYVSRTGGDTIIPSTPAVKGLVVKGAAAQAASLLELQDSAGVVLSRFDSFGSLIAPFVVAGGTAGDGRLRSECLTVGEAGLTVRGAAGQARNIAEFQSSTGAVVAAVRPDGLLTFPSASAVTVVATAGSSGAALPTAPQGFLSFWDTNNARLMKVAFYLA